MFGFVLIHGGALISFYDFKCMAVITFRVNVFQVLMAFSFRARSFSIYKGGFVFLFWALVYVVSGGFRTPCLQILYL